jgi:hypothetical protein
MKGKRNQKIYFFASFMAIQLFFNLQVHAQNCFTKLFDASGVVIAQSQLDALQSASCEMIDSLPASFHDSLKVYDFGFYLHNETMVGGYPAIFQTAINDVKQQSKYYLIFGKQTDKNGIYTKFWVAMNLPTRAQFSCMTELQREVYAKRVLKKTEEKYTERNNLFSSKGCSLYGLRL